jgi:hypothetical protein
LGIYDIANVLLGGGIVWVDVFIKEIKLNKCFRIDQAIDSLPGGHLPLGSLLLLELYPATIFDSLATLL